MARTPFFGRGPAPQIARMNMAAATASGRTWRETFQNLGQIAVSTIQDIDEKRKKKEAEEDFRLLANQLPMETFSAFGIKDEDQRKAFTDRIAKNPEARKNAFALIQFQQQQAATQQQLEANRIAMEDAAKKREGEEAFLSWFSKEQPGQLTPKGRELEGRLGRFAPSEVPGTAEYQALEASEPMGARPNIGAVALQSRMEQERGPAQAPAAMSSNRFLQSVAGANLPPSAAMRAYEVAQQKATQELARDTARLSGVESREKVIQLVNKPTADLRKEFQAQPSVKDFNKVNAAYNKIRKAFIAIKELPEEKKAAADMAVIFSYMKILDPGSTVRESEYATAQNTTGAAGKVMNWWNNVKAGQILNDVQRQAFQKVARDIAQAQFDDLNIQINFYKSIAERKGIDALKVIPKKYLDIAETGLSELPSTGGGDSDSPTTEGGDFKILTPYPSDK